MVIKIIQVMMIIMLWGKFNKTDEPHKSHGINFGLFFLLHSMHSRKIVDVKILDYVACISCEKSENREKWKENHLIYGLLNASNFFYLKNLKKLVI